MINPTPNVKREVVMLEPALPPEWLIRLGSFAAVFALVAAWEALAPRRIPVIGRRTRWPNNLGVAALNTVLVRVLAPLAPTALALLGQERGWGLFNQLALPGWVGFAASIVALDLAIYFQHVLFHAVPALWRLHRMHHADLEFDVTTGLRFHPLEIALSMAIKLAAVAVLGAPAAAVVVFEALLNGTSLFNHGNVRLPARVDRVLRYVVVTPEMHRVHHSIVRAETDSNFGFNLPWWDRMFGTYRAQPAAGHERMTIGIDRFRHPADLRLDRMLLQPFHNDGREPVPHAESTAA
jgi:sterol desaturase/sphingolipid hydroxylase (fatty acid hydroxylase superfamily)